MKAGAGLSDSMTRLLELRLEGHDHELCSGQCMRDALIRLHASGKIVCPECERPVGEPNGSGLEAQHDALEQSAHKRIVDFNGPAAARQRRS